MFGTTNAGAAGTPTPTPPTTVEITFTVEGANGDNITITNADGETVGVVILDADSTSKEYTMEIPTDGADYTFTSSVAKSLWDSSADYAKTVTLTQKTDVVYVFPRIADGDEYDCAEWYENPNAISVGGGWDITTYYRSNGSYLTRNGWGTNADNSLSYSRHLNYYQFLYAVTKNTIDLSKYTKAIICCDTSSTKGLSSGSSTSGRVATLHGNFNVSPKNLADTFISEMENAYSYVDKIFTMDITNKNDNEYLTLAHCWWWGDTNSTVQGVTASLNIKYVLLGK